MKRLALSCTLAGIAIGLAIGMIAVASGQTSTPCNTAPTPGSPHVCISWTAAVSPPTITGYNVYRATTSNGETFQTPLNPALIPSTQTFYYDTTVTIGTTYFYKAVSVGTGGVLSIPSAETSAQIPVPPNSPTQTASSID